ncbi:MAG: type I-U CRISPR-associated protein Csx17 [Methanothrix sp.]|nr:type I-U CRISPR-associated protein Csx17 [Methanothrix sp.]
MSERYDLALEGCAPVPLAHYLKSLGVVRLVSEQVDAGARCYWKNDRFHLVSTLSSSDLMKFFLEVYQPTPIVAPWNGGSGFYYQEEKLKEKDPTTGKKIKTGKRNQETEATRTVGAIAASSARRLADYRNAIDVTRKVLNEMGLEEAPGGELKETLIQAIRNRLSDRSISWLDAAVLLTSEKAKYPPLLGTGGNDGNTDFSSNFMQRLLDVFDAKEALPHASSKSWLDISLFSTTSDRLVNGVAMGQFFPGAAGGANAESGFGSNSLVNPWDFILMIEGSLFFAAATAKRLSESAPSVLSYPFSVRASGVGYGSAADSDEKTGRAEIWVPLWSGQTSASELAAMMSEGRAEIGRRPAQSGVDFARALATLGVDRGLDSFQRYGFHVRNGLAYFATPLGRFPVRRQPQVDLISELEKDRWLISFSEKAASDKAQTSVGRSLHNLERSILALCKEKGPRRVQDVMISLGKCEMSIVRSLKWAKESFVRPVPTLSSRWVIEADDGTPEFRIAASLASVYGYYKGENGQTIVMPIRSQMEPVHTWINDGKMNVAFDEVPGRDVVWSEGDPVSSMNEVMARRIMRAVQSGSEIYPDRARIYANLADIADFIEGGVDLRRMADLLWGLILVDWPSVKGDEVRRRPKSESILPCASYGVLKLCFAGGPVRDSKVPIVPEIHRRASLGDGTTAIKLATRRLRGCGLSVAFETVKMSGDAIRRTAAALLFPLQDLHIEQIANGVLRPDSNRMTDEDRSD